MRLENIQIHFESQIRSIVAKIDYLEKVSESFFKGSYSFENFSDMFTNYIDYSPYIYQIRIIDNKGNERLKITKDSAGNVQSLLNASSFNVANRYYFKELNKLDSSQFYFSPIDLNVENNEIEIPFRPTIRVGKKLKFSRANTSSIYDSFEGYILLNYNFDEIFNSNNNTSINYDLQLFNDLGYFIYHSDSELEWGLELNNIQNNFFKIYDLRDFREVENYSFKQRNEWINYASFTIGLNKYIAAFTLSYSQLRSDLLLRLKTSFIVLFLLYLINLLIVFQYSKVQIKKQTYLVNYKKKNKELNKLNKHRDEVYSIVAHDLRSPFTSIIGFSALLSKESQSLTPQQIVKFSKLIHTSSTSTLNLLDNLLAWTSLERQNIQLNSEILNLNQILDEVLIFFNGNIENKNIRLQKGDFKDINVLFDSKMLKTILRNLINNAIKFTPKNGFIKIYGEIKGNTYHLTIEDSGIGIPKSNIPTIFSSGLKQSREGTNLEKGTGLGLLLCKKFVTLNSGIISVESTEGIGTTFTFTMRLTHES